LLQLAGKGFDTVLAEFMVMGSSMLIMRHLRITAARIGINMSTAEAPHHQQQQQQLPSNFQQHNKAQKHCTATEEQLQQQQHKKAVQQQLPVTSSLPHITVVTLQANAANGALTLLTMLLPRPHRCVELR
jgi:hypothetical protein